MNIISFRFVLETVEHEKDTAVVCVGQDRCYLKLNTLLD